MRHEYTIYEWACVWIVGLPLVFLIAYGVFEAFCGKSCQDSIRRRKQW